MTYEATIKKLQFLKEFKVCQLIKTLIQSL